MTLDEAIKHEEEIANGYERNAKHIREKMKSDIALSNADDLDKYAKNHRQLAEWLKELKKFREQEPCEDCISKANALRVAKNEYLRGWHDALCKALSEKYSIHCEEGNFSVIQEETIIGLGLLMDCAIGKDVESYMSTLPSVTPTSSKIEQVEQEPFINKPCVSSGVCEHDKQKILDKIRAEIEQHRRKTQGIDPYDLVGDCLDIIDKYKESEE